MFYEVGSKLYGAFLHPAPVMQVPAEYTEIAQTVVDKIGWKTRVTGIDIETQPVTLEKNNKVALALSGGLDSVYFMRKLIEGGYDVTAVHVAGLNKSSSKFEEQYARTAAEKAGANYVKATYNAPKQTFPDNPFKNQLILSIMLDIGVSKGISKFALGSDWTTPLSEAVAGFTITDSIEVNRAFWGGY